MLSNMEKKVALGSDHAGFDYKEALKPFLEELGLVLTDFGTHSEDSVDYPDFAHPVASAVENGAQDLGLLICGSGNGVAITANKHQGIRAALCWTPELGELAVQHNNANILCLPARFISLDTAREICTAFFHAHFAGGRHANRVSKIACA